MWPAMLRITRLEENPSTVRLKLEGRLVGDWVALLAAELASGEDARPRVVLDCAGVDFANQTGVSLLRAASARGVVLMGCSPLLCSLIESAAP